MNEKTAFSTIIAPASGLGGGVAVIRISGTQAGKVFRELARTPLQAPRVAQLVTLKHPGTEKILDKAVAIYFQNPASFTGEDVLELHVHGGRAVVDNVMRAAMAVDDTIRLAEPGEFTKRGYLNGKMDLTEAEAIADLVAAETDAQAEQALSQMGGALRDLYEGWRYDLTRQLAMMEAAIDFVDEEDVPDDLLRDTNEKITRAMDAIDAHLNDGNLGERLREGFTIAVIGAPNAGKSSLVNALAKRDVAIVSDIAGTTRDMIEVHLNLGGYPVILIDTAGLREADNEIEAIGIERAKKRAAHADITLALFDATRERDAETLAAIDTKTLVVWTKKDKAPPPENAFGISVATQENIDALIEKLTMRIRDLVGTKPSTPILTRARHREAVTETRNHLSRALNNPMPELKTEDMRLAVRALGKVTGRVDVEDLLDVIFSEFCIGK